MFEVDGLAAYFVEFRTGNPEQFDVFSEQTLHALLEGWEDGVEVDHEYPRSEKLVDAMNSANGGP